jgi:hypothetical protein
MYYALNVKGGREGPNVGVPTLTHDRLDPRRNLPTPGADTNYYQVSARCRCQAIG